MQNIFHLLIFIFAICSCSNSTQKINDVSCFREINTLIKNELSGQENSNFDKKVDAVRLIIKFYINSSSRADSIIIAKSNLAELSFDEASLMKRLKNKKYICLNNVFYNKEIKPEFVTVVYNQKLIK